MARKDKMYMPQSGAGLMRYTGDTKEGIKIKPEHILIVCSGLVALEIVLRFVG